MAGSTIGNKFTITTWGESHGKALGVVVDGCPAGLPLCEEDIQVFLDRRKPGFSQFSTPRKESDTIEILSGIFEGKTTGTPISMMVRNTSQRSGDYGDIATYYRPGHADYTFDEKYGFRDYRGGGRSSGRETIGRVAAGAIASKILKELGITITTYVSSIGDVHIDRNNFDADYILKNDLNMPDPDAYEKASILLQDCMAENDSIGSGVECIVHGMPAGILGGMSDGSDIIIKAHFKPTPSIASTQKTVNKSRDNIEVSIRGRHDPIIGPRAVVVVEAMTALTILDLIFENMSSRMDKIIDFYK